MLVRRGIIFDVLRSIWSGYFNITDTFCQFCGHLRYQWPWISLRGHPRSLIFCTNRKRVYDFLLVLNSNLGPILPRFRDIRAFVRQKPILIPFPYSSQNYRVSPWSRSMMLGSAKSEHPKLTSGEIIFVRIRTYVITIPQRHKQKNGRATIAIAIPRSV